MGSTSKKFHHMYEDLKLKIEGHYYQPEDKLPSESEFMKLYDVSRYTARKVLTQLEKEDLISKIQGRGCFVQSRPLTTQITSSSTQIILIASRAEQFYFSQSISGIEKALQNSGYTLTIKLSNYNASVEAEQLYEAFKGNYAGILLFPSDSGYIYTNQYLYRYIESRKIPCISLGNVIPFVNIPSVITDDYIGGKLAAECLIKNGHSSVACLMNREEYSGCMRYAGFIEGLRTSNTIIKNDFIYWFGHSQKDSIFQAPKCNDLLKIAEKVTAFFCFNDSAAVNLYKLLKEHGYRIPDDISIIGYDDSFLCETNPLPLTSLHQDPEYAGFVAAQNLLRLINDPKFDCNKTFLPYLVERKSVMNLK